MNWFKKKRIYLDYAAATPVLPEVSRAMEKYWSEDFHNPSAIYEEGVKVRKELESFRKRAAELTGARAERVIFTSGGTAANVLAVRGVKPGKIIVEPGSHPSITDAVVRSNSREVVLISSPTADNRLGRKIRQERKESGSRYPLLHIDSSQSANYFDIGLEKLSCDLITLDSAKLYGPKGCGALVVRRSVNLNLPPLGTPSMPLIAGFVKALEMAVEDRESEYKRLNSLSAMFEETLRRSLSEAEIERVPPNIVHISVPGILPEFLALALDKEGVLVSVGPACTSNKPEPEETPVRFSFGRHTAEKDVAEAAKIFCKIVRKMVK